jgi:hypothetical protein
MTEETSLFEIFYCSVLTQDLPPATVGAIVTQARARNAQHQITGLLVFDGMRFCQHLEGPPEAVKTLMQRIDQDSRHTDVRVVYQGALAARRYSGVHALEGEAALKHFLALRSSFDING